MAIGCGMRGSRPRVGLVHWAVPPTTGGVESHVADLALMLTELGCTVTILTGECAAAPLAAVEVVYLPVLDLGLVRGRPCTDDALSAASAALGGIIEARRLEVLHGHNLHHFTAAPALALDKLRLEIGFRLHHTFHETWPDVLHEDPVYRDWDGNYAVSRFVQEECARCIGFRPQLRPLGVDVDRFTARRPPMHGRAEFVVLHPARVLPWKGVHLSVEMLAKLRVRGLPVRLVITDTQRIIDWNDELGRYRDDVTALIDRYNIASFVDFRSVPYCEMPHLYEAADVVVYPTVGDEPFGLVPLEAMSMARPIVGSRSGGMLETVVEGETGYLVDRCDSDALADCVAELLQKPQLCIRLGEAGRLRVRHRFSGREYARWLLDCYVPEGRDRTLDARSPSSCADRTDP
jgi:glycosyltransferase involved in cell wall biosynthesis